MDFTVPPTPVQSYELKAGQQLLSTDFIWAHHKFHSPKGGSLSSDAALGQSWTLGIASGPFGGLWSHM